jgi:hypothetical protein
MNSTQTSLDLLASRVQELEASNRRWKLVNALLALSAVSVALMGAKAADRIEPPVVHAGTVEPQEFILKDQAGHVYARLSLNPAAPAMKTRKGRTYFMSSQWISIPGQAALQFYDDKGEVLWTVPSKDQFVPVK